MLIPSDRKIFSVSQANKLIKSTLEDLTIWVFGEIFEFKSDQRYYYTFFSLKDPSTQAMLPCIIEPRYLSKVQFNLENGQSVLVWGNLTLFEKSGRLELKVSLIEPYGESVLAQKIEELKNKLQNEGLFALERKRKLPLFPTKIGVISSAAGEAWHDFLEHSARQFPLIEVLLKDVYVQGSLAIGDIVNAIKYLNGRQLDVIVLARGGGSTEDLLVFNSEEIARAIAQSRIPVVSAIGHEKDVTIADLVADVRASTPTDAANIITLPFRQAQEKLNNLELHPIFKDNRFLTIKYFQNVDDYLYKLGQIQQKYKQLPIYLQHLSSRLVTCQTRMISNSNVELSQKGQSLSQSAKLMVIQTTATLKHYMDKINLLSPQAILERGYSIVYTQAGSVVKSPVQVNLGEPVNIKLARGEIKAAITGTGATKKADRKQSTRFKTDKI